MRTALTRAIPAVAMVALALALAPPALGQEQETLPVPVAELSGGYTFMRDFTDQPSSGHVDLPKGWYASGAYNVNQWFGVVMEATQSYRNNIEYSWQDWSSSQDWRVQTYLGGPRFFRQSGRFVPFAQVLAGAATLRVRSRITGAHSYEGSGSSTEFALQPGAGLTVYLTRQVGVRFSGDYRTIIDFAQGEENAYTNEFRVISGFTLHWGAR